VAARLVQESRRFEDTNDRTGDLPARAGRTGSRHAGGEKRIVTSVAAVYKRKDAQEPRVPAHEGVCIARSGAGLNEERAVGPAAAQ
jgi:hypothetical protein